MRVFARRPLRRGTQVVEAAGLENRYARKGIVGSNPTLSAMSRAGEIVARHAGCHAERCESPADSA
jgi:hypothetical protein